MLIKNVKIYTEEKNFVDGAILIKDGVFEEVLLHTGADEISMDIDDADRGIHEAVMDAEEVIDGHGAYAIPGLIDIHFHGCQGYDFCDGTMEAMSEIARYEARIGVTAIAPATMTLPVGELEGILKTAAHYQKESSAINPKGADLVGINMEGPFISKAKKGAQDAENIILCDEKICRRFLEASEGLVKFVGIAPEESEHAITFIRQMKDKVKLSLAHTNADFETANAAFQAGAKHVVHLYNGMSPFSHREPGVVGAAADHEQVTVEMICDGIHIHPAVVRATLKMLGTGRVVFVSDSMRATGMSDGNYTLGGLDVEVTGKRAVLTDGTLAGSTTNLMDCMRTAVKEMKIPLEAAVACVTVNPANAIGIFDRYGSITRGKKGNVVLLDEELQLKAVIKDGNRL